MGKPTRRKGNPAKNKYHNRLQKNKNYRRDLDQIYEDLNGLGHKVQMIKEKEHEVAGQGLFYCVPCALHCVSKSALQDHATSKPHKRRVKVLAKEKPYDHKEAELLNK